MLELLSKPRNNFKAFFIVHYKELKPLCEYIKKKMRKERETRDLTNELKSLINELEGELKSVANKNFNYVVVPGIKFREVSKESKEHSNIRGDFDGLYIKIPRDANAKIEMMVIEAKRRGNYSGKQLKRIIENVGEEISDEEARKIAQSLVRKRRYENMYVNIKKIIGRGCKYIRLYFKI